MGYDGDPRVFKKVRRSYWNENLVQMEIEHYIDAYENGRDND
jgi:hypothetical protein